MMKKIKEWLAEDVGTKEDGIKKTFYTRIIDYCEEMNRSWVEKYTPHPWGTPEGWQKMAQHSNDNIEGLVRSFRAFSSFLVLEIKLQSFKTVKTSDLYQRLINELETVKSHMIKCEEAEDE